MIMVDELIDYGVKVRGNGPEWCHMTTDDFSEEGLAEFHRFAKRLGLKRTYCSDYTQPDSHLHYDLVASKRQMALDKGAIFVPALTQARKRLGLPQGEQQ